MEASGIEPNIKRTRILLTVLQRGREMGAVAPQLCFSSDVRSYHLGMYSSRLCTRSVCLILVLLDESQYLFEVDIQQRQSALTWEVRAVKL